MTTNLLDKIVGTPGCLVEVSIFSDGRPFTKRSNLLSVTITKEIGKIPKARLTLLESDCESKNTKKKLSERDFLKPGKKIKILAGSVAKKEVVFEGVILKKQSKVREGDSPVLVVDCKDEAIKLTFTQKNKTFTEGRDSEFMSEVLSEYKGLTVSIEPTKVKHLQMQKYNVTDWDFILARAEANARLVIVDDGKISIKKPKSSVPAAGLPVITNDNNVLDASAQINAQSQYQKIVTAAWSPSEQAWIEEEGNVNGLEEQGNIKSNELGNVLETGTLTIRHSGEMKPEELKALADGMALRSRLSRLCGNIKIDFSPRIKLADFIVLKDFGERFDGKIFVTGIKHELAKGTGYTHVQFGFKQEVSAMNSPQKQSANIPSSTPAGSTLPSIQGLHIGTITQLEEDSDKHYRVKVKLPVIDQNEAIWARMSFADAGNERGFFFMPEIDDEVVVGFINEDARHPVILGMLHSSSKAAPFEPTDDNHEKGLVTRSGMKITFNDEHNNILISTPANNEIQLNEEEEFLSIKDQNNNCIKMDSNGITIESAGDLIFKAQKDIKIEGMNIENKATANFKAEGTAGAELTTNATNVIKGSLVQIN